MKKILAIWAVCLMVIQLQAQDINLLDSIKATNSKIKTFEADLANTLVKPKKTTTQHGKLYFVSPYHFAAQFTTGKFMVVNDKKINMNIGLFDGTFRLRDGGIMQSLANIFLYGFQGRIQQLANENDYSMITQTESGYYVVTCTVRKRKLIGIGYQTVVFKYHTDSLLLKEIVLYDYSGNMDSYTISNVQYDVAVDPNIFVF